MYPQRVKELDEKLKEGEFDELKKLAHRLKGAGGTHGYPVVSDLARSLEKAALENDTAQSESCISELDKLVDCLAPDSEG